MPLLLTLLTLSSAPQPVRLEGADLCSAREVPLMLINDGDAPVSLRRAVTLERRVGKLWEAQNHAPLFLRTECAVVGGVLEPGATLTGCITLQPHTTFTSMPWLATVGDAQCVCERCAWAPHGTYRYTTTERASDERVIGEPFELR